MLKDNINQYILKAKKPDSAEIELYKEEKEYIVKHQIEIGNVTIIEKNPGSRFEDAYIERGDKETEEMLGVEEAAFLKESITYFKNHKNEFLYMESAWFEMIRADAVSFEIDDVFETYDVMLGLKLPKKSETAIRTFISSELSEDAGYDLMFSQKDGLWDFNFTLNYADGFMEEMTIGEAYDLIYQVLFRLVESVEEKRT